MKRDNISDTPLIDFLKAELKINPKMTSTDAVRLARENHYNEDESTIQSVFTGIVNEAKMERISKTGSKLFRGNVGPDSKPIGIISLEPTGGARFTPTSGESLTYRELQQICDYVKQNDQHERRHEVENPYHEEKGRERIPRLSTDQSLAG